MESKKSSFTVKWSARIERANNAITVDSAGNSREKGSSIHLGIFDETPTLR